MTRGKHGKKSAERRAQSAEDQLDRLLPELQAAKQLARQYRTAAERVPVLERDLRQLRAVTGPSQEDHDATLAAADEERSLAELELHKMYRDMIDALCDIIKPRLDLESRWISGRLCTALHALPAGYADEVLSGMGVERQTRRMILNRDSPGVTTAAAQRDSLNLNRASKEAGLSGIPHEWVDRMNERPTS